MAVAGVKIEGAEKLAEIVKRFARKAPKAVAKGLLRASLYQEGVVRDVIREKFPNARTGALARSFKASVVKDDGDVISAGVFSDLVYARIQDEGGTIRPKNAKALAIPLKKLPVGKWPRHFGKNELTLIKSRKGNALLVDARKLARGQIDPVFVLKDSSKIRGKGYLKTAAERASERIAEIIAETTADAMREAGD